MMPVNWKAEHAFKSRKRIQPRVEKIFHSEIQAQTDEWDIFLKRLDRHWETLFDFLHRLYGWQYDFFYTLEQIFFTLAKSWLERPLDLKSLDRRRELDPHWFLSEQMVGGVLYVDLFSDNLSKLQEHIPYFRKLGLTYLHLMPLFAVPHGQNDGGYAVSDYRAVNPDIGSMTELADLARRLRDENISLVLDFVFNHTSDDHQWALKAKNGDTDYQAFYHIFPDRSLPDQYQKHLRDIFPDLRRGNFTFNPELRKWVWTTFNNYQWDLNYANAEVFRAMAEEMLFLANRGVEVLRLDAVAFIWKRLGTPCENLPEAHWIIQAFNCLARIAAPSLLFKSEAIVAPNEVIQYVDQKECQLSYNPLLMALLWESLATRRVSLLNQSIQHYGQLPKGCAWVNYLRCHDDIGWTFDDDDARSIGIDPGAHRHFLNQFYTGRFEGSFAKGVPFQYNPETGDLRISGTLASLAGLELAIEQQHPEQIEMAVRRINLLRSIMLSAGGLPLIYLGDEWGMVNDYTYLSDPAKAGDSRWVHRCKRRWEANEDLTDQETLEWRFFNEMVKLIQLRKSLPALWNTGIQVIDTGNPHLFGYLRQNEHQRLLVVNNFSETPQIMSPHHLAADGVAGERKDLISLENLPPGNDLILEGYRFAWLAAPEQTDAT